MMHYSNCQLTKELIPMRRSHHDADTMCSARYCNRSESAVLQRTQISKSAQWILRLGDAISPALAPLS